MAGSQCSCLPGLTSALQHTSIAVAPASKRARRAPSLGERRQAGRRRRRRRWQRGSVLRVACGSNEIGRWQCVQAGGGPQGACRQEICMRRCAFCRRPASQAIALHRGVVALVKSGRLRPCGGLQRRAGLRPGRRGASARSCATYRLGRDQRHRRHRAPAPQHRPWRRPPPPSPARARRRRPPGLGSMAPGAWPARCAACRKAWHRACCQAFGR